MSSSAPPARVGHDAGFTLIETLVALSVLALLAGVLAGGVTSTRLVLAFLERSNVGTSVQSAQGYLRASLSQARTKPERGADEIELSFRGDAWRMAYITSHAPRGRFEGLYAAEVAVEPSLETAGALSVRIAHGPIWMTQPGAGGEARATSTLLDNVAAAKFVYFGTFDEAVPPQWHETWEHPTRLPSLVAVDTRFAPGDPRQWHRLVIQIAAADSSSVRCPPRSTCR